MVQVYRTRRETCPYFKLLSWNPITTITLAFRWAFSSHRLAQSTSLLLWRFRTGVSPRKPKFGQGIIPGKHYEECSVGPLKIPALHRLVGIDTMSDRIITLPNPGDETLSTLCERSNVRNYHDPKSDVKTQVAHGTVISSSFFLKPDSCVSGDLAMRLCGVTVSF